MTAITAMREAVSTNVERTAAAMLTEQLELESDESLETAVEGEGRDFGGVVVGRCTVAVEDDGLSPSVIIRVCGL